MSFEFKYLTANNAIKDHWNKRAFAYFFDLVAVLAIYFIVWMAFLALFGGEQEGIRLFDMFIMAGGNYMMMAEVTAITTIIAVFYFGYFDGAGTGTMGKRFLGLLVESTAGPISIQKGVVRNSFKLLGILIGGIIGLGMVAILMTALVILDLFLLLGDAADPRQKYSDKMAGTTVVRGDIDEDIKELLFLPPEPESPKLEQPADKEVPVSAGAAEPGGAISDDEREAVIKYKELFGLTEERSLNLYRAGYKRLSDFEDAIPEDLIIVNKINPTTARAIIQRAREELGR